ncbi:neuromedin-B isoform X3 [Cuculus canorus]|uniref:neuromedin-B isoform X3 n=1 Tax=Cuculus canorus TaxID=55661 RepID=UPI0023AB36B0|nr:neuromedin-B isoform X3 [Cuculus canorus]
MWALRCLVLLLCGAALGPAVHLDFAEHRSQAAKIKVNPRGNLWATGHFMGKKSVTGSPHLEPPEEPAVPTAFGPSLRALLEEMVELLTRELLRVLWRERLLDENQGKYDLTDQFLFSSSVFIPAATLDQGCPSLLRLSLRNSRTAGVTAPAHHEQRWNADAAHLSSLGHLPCVALSAAGQNLSTDPQKRFRARTSVVVTGLLAIRHSLWPWCNPRDGKRT